MWIKVWVAGEMCEQSLTRANLSALEMNIAHVIKRYTDLSCLHTYLLTYLKIVETAVYIRSVAAVHSSLGAARATC